MEIGEEGNMVFRWWRWVEWWVIGVTFALSACEGRASEIPPAPPMPSINGYPELHEAGYLLNDLLRKEWSPVRMTAEGPRTPIAPADALSKAWNYSFPLSPPPQFHIPQPTLSDAERKAIFTQAMEDTQPVLYKLHSALSKPIQFPIPETLFSAQPNYSNLRMLIRLLVMKARWDKENLQWHDYLNDLHDTLRITSAVGRKNTLVGYLVSISIEYMVMKQLFRDLPTLPESVKADLLPILLNFYQDYPEAADALRVSRDVRKRTYRWLSQFSLVTLKGKMELMEFDRQGNLPSDRVRWMETYAKSLQAWFELHFLFADLLKETDEMYETTIQQCDSPYVRRASIQEFKPWSVLNLQTSLDYRKICDRRDAHQALLGILILTLAAERAHTLTGKYPDSLGNLLSSEAALSSLQVPALILDPFTGEFLLYRLEGEKVLIYSRGPDGDDDGGKTLLWQDWSIGKKTDGDITLTTLAPPE